MKTKELGELGQEVMDIIWEKQKCTIRDVVNELQQTRQIAYTTVATILQRLYDKGLLKRTDEGKKGHVYTPKISKKIYTKNLAQSFLNKFMGSFGDIALASFVESIEELPKKKKEYFLKLLDEHDKSK